MLRGSRSVEEEAAFRFARHCGGDLQGDILNDVSRDTRHETADTGGVFNVHIADEYVRERAVLDE
jgi:hypothetical protein